MNLKYYLSKYFQNVILHIMLVILIVISYSSFNFPGASEFMPNLNIMIIFYWSIYNPEKFPIYISIILSILEDCLIGAPIGLNVVSNIFLYGLITSNRQIFVKEPFKFIWTGFAIFVFIATILKYILISIIFKKIFPVSYPLMQLLIMIFLYPLMHIFFNKTNNLLFIKHAK
ncbi:MAG: rod shape-determining protein MreD [Alphaproteobacteria bacterium]